MRSESDFANRYAKVAIASLVRAFSSKGADVHAGRAVRAARFAAVPRSADSRDGGVGDGWLGLLAIHDRTSGSATTRVG